jgi:hypothetical protein
MNPRIQLDESTPEEPLARMTDSSRPPATARQLLDADWENTDAEPLLLYVAEEPRVGLEFSYHGLDWQIVDYHDGWVAKMVVE